ncbi:hypothetical protein EC973_008954 [Apophysomyces ossiformis]|uniref:MIR domain-containing protein n=1 Tax=Apophysomyces ossiformis TaxID=679940 RepID=A0A8H7BMW5_9FUNG|nr:hypothetical protein EC973_008954 [Apophysomyces ossiformis]
MMFSLRYRRLSSKSETSLLYYNAKEEEESYDAKMKKPAMLATQRYRPEALGLVSMTILSLIIRESELEIAKQVNWYLKGQFFISPYPPLASLIYAKLAKAAGYLGTEQFLYSLEHVYYLCVILLFIGWGIPGQQLPWQQGLCFWESVFNVVYDCYRYLSRFGRQCKMARYYHDNRGVDLRNKRCVENAMRKTHWCAYGSKIVLRHLGTSGGFLHSHKAQYESGSTQQMVSLYPYEDFNNVWIVQKPLDLWNGSEPVELVRNNDQIRLEHYPSTRRLHSHDHRPPMSNKPEHHEVTAYGDRYIEDPHDFWWLRVANEDGKLDPEDRSPLQALNSRIRLLHVRGCYLMSHNMPLPPPGELQQEVTCMTAAKASLSTWVIESAFHEFMTDEEDVFYDPPTTTEKLREIHKLMWNYPSSIYDRLAPKPSLDKLYQPSRDNLMLKPFGYFLHRQCQRFWDDLTGRSVHMVFNPWAQLLMVSTSIAYMLYLCIETVLNKRHIKFPEWMTFDQGIQWVGYDIVAVRDLYRQSFEFLAVSSATQVIVLHFFPAHAWKMADVLHSAYYYGIGLTAVAIEAATFRLKRSWRLMAYGGILLVGLISFVRLIPLSFGSRTWSMADCERANFFNMDCQRFPKRPVTDNQTLLTVYVEMPGKTHPFKYQAGGEAQADHHVALLKHATFQLEARKVSGSARFHRALSTPAITNPEIAAWQEEVISAAVERERKLAEEGAGESEEDEEEDDEEEEEYEYEEGETEADGVTDMQN